MGGGFAGEVATIELLYGGIEVVEVKRHGRRDAPVGVDLDDVGGIVLNRLGIAPRAANTRDGEMVAAGRRDAHHRVS